MKAIGAVDLRSHHERRSQLTEIAHAARAVRAAPTRGKEGQDDRITFGQFLNPFAALHDCASTLMTPHYRQWDREVAGHQMFVGMAQAGGRQPHEDLPGTWRIQIDFFDLPLLLQAPQNSRTCLHVEVPSIELRFSSSYPDRARWSRELSWMISGHIAQRPAPLTRARARYRTDITH